VDAGVIAQVVANKSPPKINGGLFGQNFFNNMDYNHEARQWNLSEKG
jgi:hypothetical protein